jgi:hypothetical protein
MLYTTTSQLYAGFLTGHIEKGATTRRNIKERTSNKQWMARFLRKEY